MNRGASSSSASLGQPPPDNQTGEMGGGVEHGYADMRYVAWYRVAEGSLRLSMSTQRPWMGRKGTLKIPTDAAIPMEKLTHYLLVFREWDDKSKFLAQAGFTQENPHLLLASLRKLAERAEAVEDGDNEYGEFLRADGELIGPKGRALSVVTIWLRWRLDGRVQFVTLKPRKETRK